MSGKQLDAALQQLYNAPAGGPSASSIKQFLQLVRDTKTRRSEAVCHFGSLLLTKYVSSISQDERWLVQEQVAMAAMDSHAYDAAHALIDGISHKFPGSMRATRLQGMFYELLGRWDDAKEVYTNALKDNPAQPYIWKRQVAVQRAQGNLHAAIDTLTKFLELSPLDAEGWEELADLYITVQLPGQAAFCLEELILLNPSSTSALLRYAHVQHGRGTPEALATARTYYSTVVQLTEGTNAAALYGVCATTSALAAGQGKGRQNSTGGSSRFAQDIPEDLGQLAATKLLQLYARESPGLVPVAKATLTAMGFR